MNILKVQDTLKNLSDSQLAQEIRMPSGAAPQFLVMTEMQRRQKMRAAAQNTGEKPSIAEEMAGEAPPEQDMPPEGQPPQNAGIMSLPDATAAGNVMKARITGQPQQVGDMTALPPQGMAEGGAVTFGNIFGGQSGPATQPSSTPALIQQSYMPKNGYVPPKETNYADQFSHLFSTTKGAPNPRVRMSDAERYGIPAGMAAPAYGTPGLNRSYSGRDGQNVRYSFANDAARDAYIRSMMPSSANNSAITSAMAAQNAGSTVPPRAMADGGPIRMFSGMEVEGDPNTSPAYDLIFPYRSPEELAAIREAAVKFGEGKVEQERRLAQLRAIYAAETAAKNGQRGPLVEFFTPKGKTAEANLAASMIPGSSSSRLTPQQIIEGSRRQLPSASGAPTQLDVNQNYDPEAQPPSLMPSDGGMAQPNLDFNPAALLAAQAAVQPKARGSIAPPVRDLAGKEPAGQVGNEASPVQPKSKYEEMAMAKLEAMRGNDAEDRKNDINMALIQAGLGMASSKNPRFLAALAEGATPALAGYTDARRLAKKGEREFGATELGIMGNVENIRAQEATRAQSQGQFDTTAGLQREQLGLTRRQLDNQAGAAKTANEIALETLQLNRDKIDQLPDDFRTLKALHEPGNEALLAAYNATNGNKEIKAAQSYIDGYNKLIEKGMVEPTAEQTETFNQALSVVSGGFGGARAAPVDRKQQLYGKIANSLMAGQKTEAVIASLKSQFPDATDADIQVIIDNAKALIPK